MNVYEQVNCDVKVPGVSYKIGVLFVMEIDRYDETTKLSAR